MDFFAGRLPGSPKMPRPPQTRYTSFKEADQHQRRETLSATLNYSSRWIIDCTTISPNLTKSAFSPVKERIVVPRKVLPGLLTALHIKLIHPSMFHFNTFLLSILIQRCVPQTIIVTHASPSKKSIMRPRLYLL